MPSMGMLASFCPRCDGTTALNILKMSLTVFIKFKALTTANSNNTKHQTPKHLISSTEYNVSEFVVWERTNELAVM